LALNKNRKYQLHLNVNEVAVVESPGHYHAHATFAYRHSQA